MKAILISIRPKWVEKIVSGEKMIEVRKTAPKEVPFKCYIYCTKHGKQFFHNGIGEKECLFKNPDTGKIKFDYAFEVMCCKNDYSKDNFLSGKVIGEFVCDKITMNLAGYDVKTHECAYFTLLNGSCLSKEELMNYGKHRVLYGWHISDLKIYDKPKELSEFWTIKCTNKKNGCMGCEVKPNCIKTITKPFQSWGYIEGYENNMVNEKLKEYEK